MERNPKKHIGRLLFLVIAAVLVVSIFPMFQRIKDGGSIFFRSLVPLYKVYIWNGENTVDGSVTKGVTVYVFDREIYNSYRKR